MKGLLLAVALLQGGTREPPTPVPSYPWAVGETLTYSAKLGLLSLGAGTLEVAGLDTVRGTESFRFRFRLQGKTIIYSLDDVLESYVGTRDLVSRRFVQDFVENEKPSHRHFEIYPDSGFFRETGKPEAQPSPPDPLDDAAFFYFVRVTPLEVGKKYVYNRYFRKEKNPVTIEVLKREKMNLPDGRAVDCLVLHPDHRHQGNVLEALGDPDLADRRRPSPAGPDQKQVPVRHHHAPAQGHEAATHTAVGGGPLGVTYHEADLSRLRTVPVAERRNKVDPSLLAVPPGADHSFAAFLASLPDLLAARDLRAVIEGVAAAARARRGVVLLVGGHVIKVGLGPLLRTLIAGGVVTHVALNGAAAIHDFELAAFGGTSEDVESGLADGTFGMAEETGLEMNAAVAAAARDGQGMGEGLARALAARAALPGREASVLLAARERDVPVTVHAAIGAEIIHQHPTADGAAIGATSHRDFRRLAGSLPSLHQGGAVLNLGSAVLLPEVFLKALTIARNLESGRPTHFLAADFDMQRHYRPRVNVVQRPTRVGGVGYQLTGHHEVMLPLLVWGVLEALGEG